MNLAGAVCLGACWLVSNHYPPWNSFYNESLALVALLILTVAARGARLTAPAAFLLAVAGVPLLQWAGGMLAYGSDVAVSLLYLLAAALALTIGAAGARADGRGFVAMLAGTLVVASVVSSVIAMTQCLQTATWGLWVIEFPSGGRAVGNLAQPNNLATLLAFGALSVWALFEQRRFGAVTAAALLLPLVIGLGLTQSRTALVFGPAICLAFWVARRNGVAWRARFGAVAAVGIVHIAFTLAWPALAQALLVAPSTGFVDRGVGGGRLEVWKVLISALGQAPWTGFGWLQTGAAQLAEAERHPPGMQAFFQAHNLFIDLLAWCGWPLGIALGGAGIVWFVGRWRRVASCEGGIGMMVLTVFCVHSMLELPFHYAYLLVPVGLWAGAAEGLSAGPAPGRAVGRFARGLVGAVAAAIALLGAALAWNYSEVEADFRLMRFQVLGIGPPATDRRVPDAPLLSSLTDYLWFTRVRIGDRLEPAELERMATVVKRYPYQQSLYRYAAALAVNGRLPQALGAFRAICHIHGEAACAALAADVRRRAAEGEPALAPLARALPA